MCLEFVFLYQMAILTEHYYIFSSALLKFNPSKNFSCTFKPDKKFILYTVVASVRVQTVQQLCFAMFCGALEQHCFLVNNRKSAYFLVKIRIFYADLTSNISMQTVWRHHSMILENAIFFAHRVPSILEMICNWF